MSGFTLGWALEAPETESPAEVLTLYYIAGTAGTDNHLAEIRLDTLLEQTKQSEAELRGTLNSLAEKRLIMNVKPSEGQPTATDARGDGPRIFDCELNTPQKWRWNF